MKTFDLVVLGGGPGGYVAAIRAAQLGKSVAVVEKDKLGGVCLNRGCIPTKALLKSAHSVHEVKGMKALGVEVELKGLNAAAAIKRANQISNRISKGVSLLMKKNKIEVISGEGKLKDKNTIVVESEEISAKNIILATGAHYKSFPGVEHDGDRLIGASEALKMDELPESIGIIGAGAIGVEFAYFWNAFGVKVHIFEIQKHLLPLEDEDCSKELERSYKRYGIKSSLGLESLSVVNDGESAVISLVKDGNNEEHKFEKVLIAVGMTGNVDDIGLSEVGVKVERGFVVADEFGQSSVEGIYAIGDLSGPPLLAHVASHEGVIAVEHMMGLKPHAIDRDTIPGCTYCQPQVASVGRSEQKLIEDGVSYKVGKLPFMANGKAVASNEKDGFVKVLLGDDGKLLGAHIVGNCATELLHEYTLLKGLGKTAADLTSVIHPHPTLGEWLAEAMLDADGKALNY